ncbi:MAG: TonB family protein [Pseudomonadota bacterium]
MKEDDPTNTGLKAKPVSKRYAKRRKPLSWPLLLGIALLHIAVLYGLARALVPDIVTSVEREVVAAFDVSETPSPPPPENIPEPDEGAQGDTGEKAVAAPVSAPPSKLPIPATIPLPPAASTGDKADSGAGQSGDGTGAAGVGVGTGSGNQGSGAGGVAVTRPEHISGSISNARDYPTPPGGREARRGTEVIVRVIVGTNGRARNCSIYRASPDVEADRITCQLVVERLGFRPAQDANGNPVDAPFYWRQRWF